MATVEEKACIVCGKGSHRTDWINKGEDYVACDNHTPAEIKKALDASKPAVVPIDKPTKPIDPPKPPTPVATPVAPLTTPATTPTVIK
jgi:hypothetical protein